MLENRGGGGFPSAKMRSNGNKLDADAHAHAVADADARCEYSLREGAAKGQHCWPI